MPSAAANPEISVVVFSKGDLRYTLNCIASVAECGSVYGLEIIVSVVLASRAAQHLNQNAQNITIIDASIDRNFAQQANQAIQQCKGQYVLLLNEYSEVSPGSIDELYNQAKSAPHAAVIGPKILALDATVADAGRIIWSDASTSNWAKGLDKSSTACNYVRKADFISSTAQMLSVPLWRKLNRFDENYKTAEYAAADLAIRARLAGWQAVFSPTSSMIWHGAKLDDMSAPRLAADVALLNLRYGPLLRVDHFERLTHALRARDRAAGKYIVIVVDFDIPQLDRDAGSHNIFEMMRSLQHSGNIVKFWPDNQEGDARHRLNLEKLGIEVLSGQQCSFEDWIDKNRNDVDVVLSARPEVALPYLDTLSRRAPAVARVYYGHDLHHRRMAMEACVKRDKAIAQAAKQMKYREWVTWREADVVAYPSEEEAASVSRIDTSIEAVPIVPFCFDTFPPIGKPPQNNHILFVAGFAHAPNVDAAMWLARSIFPLVSDVCPNAKLFIAGSNPTADVLELQKSTIVVTGSLTTAELEDLYGKARVAVVPLRFGAGVKLKVVEAFQRGLPLVTTPVGVQGLQGAEDIVVVADDIATLAAEIIRLLRQDDLWTICAERQQRYAKEWFARQRSVEAMDRLVEVALARAAERLGTAK